MSPKLSLVQAIIERTLVVPKIGILGDLSGEFTKDLAVSSERVSRQLDIALISAGFKADTEVLSYVSRLTKSDAIQLSKEIVNAVQHLTGDHVKHNTYFKSFPDDVPDTIEFWTKLVQDTFGEYGFMWDGNLLALDGYGKYQHTYEEMLQEHKPFVEKLNRKLKPIKLGGTFQAEVNKLFLSLAESSVPLNEGDRNLLVELARVSMKTPSKIPVRENKAIINSVYIEEGLPVLVDTIGDILRLAAYVSGGDVTLQTKTKYKFCNNAQKRAVLKALGSLPDSKLADVKKYSEQVKALITYLHGARYDSVRRVLDVAAGRNKIETPMGRVEKALAANDVQAAVKELEKLPGRLLRKLNELLLASKIKDLDSVYTAFERAIEGSSLRVILSLRQYMENRNVDKIGRVFVNKKGGTYVLQEQLEKLPDNVVERLKTILDTQVRTRLEESQLAFDSSILHYALPISDKHRAQGLNVVPRGTETGLDKDAEVLRLFTYWKQKEQSTDFDLSVILLDENFNKTSQVSYTNLREIGAVHSGDITSAPKGASEFIDLELDKVKAKYIVPQVNIYSGESFDDTKEAFFGYMLRTLEEKGKPFEAKTVETKSDLYGTNRIALPMVFINTDNGWKVKQLNLFIKGYAAFNATENNSTQTQVLLQSIVADNFLTMEYLADKVDLKMPIVDYDDDGNQITLELEQKEITHTNLHEAILE